MLFENTFPTHRPTEEDLMSESEEKFIVPVNWPKMYAKRAEGLSASAIREILKLTAKPEIISFAGGLPANELLPCKEVRKAANIVLSDKKTKCVAMQYGATEGYGPLKEYLCERMREYNVPAEVGNVTITNGAQGAIFLSGLMFIDRGTMVLVESPTYLGMIQAWTHLGAKFCTIPIDKDGMMVDLLPGIIEKYHPKIIYTMPDFHNPAGVTMSLERRIKFAEIVSAHDDIIVIEDNPYGKLRYEGEHLPPIVSLAKEHTFYLGTVSKIMAPGLRVGWMVAPKEPVAKMFQAIQGECLFTSVFLQMLVHNIFTSGAIDERILKIRNIYRKRRDTMLREMEKHFPKEIVWTYPEGGLFLWVTTPGNINSLELFKSALEENVAFVPGASFYANGEEKGLHTFRMNFSFSSEKQIRTGIKRLGLALRKALAS
jgi:2-aminoadipate transaminase